MKWIFRICVLAFVCLAIALASQYVIHKDIYFFTDIARDFLLLEELDAKKIIFIGPRSSTTGLFHGPLWLYLNYSAYVIGGGNPVVVGWFWVGLIAVFLASSYFIAYKLFNELTASFYVVLLGTFVITETRGLYNPYGAFLLTPVFLYCFVRFIEKKTLLWAAFIMFLAGLITQFQLAIGIPLAIISAITILVMSIKTKRYLLLSAILIYLLPLSTFILFELRHDWIMTKSAYKYVFQDKLAGEYTSVFSLLADRLSLMTGGGLGLFRNFKEMYSRIGFFLLAIMVATQLRQRKYVLPYISIIIIYCGFHSLTAINKTGGMLYQYYMPFFPITLLVVASSVTSKWKMLFVPLVLYVIYISMTESIAYANFAPSVIGKSEDSWKYNLEVARDLFAMPETGFGYFIYSPDTFAYEQKYAVHYVKKQSTKTTYESTKKPITYVIVAPPPPGNSNMKDEWWKVNKLRIDKKPQTVKTYPTGARIDRYELTPEEITIAPDPSVDLGIFFR
jgi:hypothetical protein